MNSTNKTKQIFLSEIENSDVITTPKQTINVEDLIVIKRDGRHEVYDANKMRRVCMWASDGVEVYADALLSSTRIKLYNKIKIQDVYDQLIKSAANKINRISPQYEKIAAKLLLLKIYKNTWNIKKTEYPDYASVIREGIKKNKYSKEVFEAYSDEEIAEIGTFINGEFDFLFTYKSLYIFYEKYCINASKNKKLELPQHVYMRIALALFKSENKAIRLKLIKEFYMHISNHAFTMATPIMLNAGTPNQQLSSCVLMKMDDDSKSIMNTIKSAAIYSKNKGGIAVDVSSVRSTGSYIHGNDGVSSGPVPFIKIIESTIKAFNQGSQRPGACCIYFQWWHYNFKQLVVLKNNTGTEENRARQLKYSVKINQLLIDRTINNEDITLFDPKDVPELQNIFGEEFNKKYVEYENKSGIKKTVIKARELIYWLFKERAETGNIYLFHEENVNEGSLLKRYINSSNLCCEIVLPSRPSNFVGEHQYTENKDKPNVYISKRYEAGEIALCNLASINLLYYENSSKAIKKQITNILVRALDNTIDEARYPVIEGSISNSKYRFLGIGVLNMANYLATKNIVIDTQEALEMTHKIFDNLTYNIIESSHEIGLEKGSFPEFNNTEWAEGKLPIFKANKKALNLTEYQPDMAKWKKLADEIARYGIRNAQLLAIAPTATSGKAINASESIEPIQNLFYKEDGKINIPSLAPNIKNWRYYKLATDCDQYMLLKAAAIRQCYLDQAQSINVYFKKISSLLDFSLFHFLGFELGIKTFYYCKTLKQEIIDVCESCS